MLQMIITKDEEPSVFKSFIDDPNLGPEDIVLLGYNLMDYYIQSGSYDNIDIVMETLEKVISQKLSTLKHISVTTTRALQYMWFIVYNKVKHDKFKAYEALKRGCKVQFNDVPFDNSYFYIEDKSLYGGKLENELALFMYYNEIPGVTGIEKAEEMVRYGELAVQHNLEDQVGPEQTQYRENLKFYTMAFTKEEARINHAFEKNKICVYAICKNEEQFVDKWVESMIEADLIVVLDTGSTNGTMDKFRELQKKYPNKIILEQKIIDPWRFDTARNESLKLVPPEYNILVSTDLDEVFEPGWAEILRNNWIEGVHERGVYKYSWSHLSNGASGRVFHYDKIHSRKWIWKYPVHELLWNTKTDSNKFSSYESCELFDQIHLHHYPDKTKSRGQYLPLLEQRAKEDPNDYYGLIYLAHEYYYRGEYQKSIDLLTSILTDHEDHYNLLEKASCYLFIGDDYHSLKDVDNAIKAYTKAINIDPTYREPYLGIADILIEQKKYSEAIRYIKTALRKSFRHYTWLERDTSWTYKPYDMLSIASFYAGNKRDSLAYATKAYYYDKNDERLKNNIDLILDNMSDAELLS